MWRRQWHPLQYSCLENPTDGGAWWAAVHVVAKSRTRLNNFTFTFQFHALEKEMATHSSVLAWRIPGAGEPGGLPSTGSYRVGHDWSDAATASSVNSKEPACQCRRYKRHMGLIPESGRSLEEGMATHSSILAWRILWPEESGSLQSIRLQRVGHDRSFWAQHSSAIGIKCYFIIILVSLMTNYVRQIFIWLLDHLYVFFCEVQFKFFAS